MAKLTVKQLEALTPADDGKTLREEGGLVGKVRAGLRGVTVLFRYEFKLNGEKRDYRLGSWPKKSLADIRGALIGLKSTVSKGIDPTQAKKAERIEAQAAVAATIAAAEKAAKENLTVYDLVVDWLKDGVARQDGNKELSRSFSKDVIPQIGSKPLRELSEKDLLAVLRAVKARGLNRAVVVLHNNLKQMLRWGEKRRPWRALMVDGNPAELIDVEKLLDPDYQEERDRILSPQEIRELHDIFSKLEHDYASLPAGRKYEGIRPVSPQVQLAVWICFGTLCRIGELLKAEWRHVDLINGIWRIPAENTKGHRGKRQEHVIFLSGFARRQFYALHALTGSSPFLFPASRKEDHHLNEKTVSKQIGDRQIQFKDRKPLPGRQNNNTLVLSNGANGEWTPHDMRRTGATMMQELGVALDIIDRCQNHVLAGSKVRRHYLHHDYAKEKAAAWEALGQRVELILEGRAALAENLADEPALTLQN